MTEKHNKTGSTQQITNKMLAYLSTTEFDVTQMQEATDFLRAMVSVRWGGVDSYEAAKELCWKESHQQLNGENDIRQGMAFIKLDEYIADIMANLFSDEVVKERMKKHYPQMSNADVTAVAELVPYLFKNIEYSRIDNRSKVDFDKIDIKAWKKKLLNNKESTQITDSSNVQKGD